MICSIIAQASTNGAHIVIVKASVIVRGHGVRDKYRTMLTSNPDKATELICKDDLTNRRQAYSRYRKMIKAINHVTIKHHEELH
jgi:hypothetical protein